MADDTQVTQTNPVTTAGDPIAGQGGVTQGDNNETNTPFVKKEDSVNEEISLDDLGSPSTNHIIQDQKNEVSVDDKKEEIDSHDTEDMDDLDDFEPFGGEIEDVEHEDIPDDLFDNKDDQQENDNTSNTEAEVEENYDKNNEISGQNEPQQENTDEDITVDEDLMGSVEDKELEETKVDSVDNLYVQLFDELSDKTNKVLDVSGKGNVEMVGMNTDDTKIVYTIKLDGDIVVIEKKSIQKGTNEEDIHVMRVEKEGDFVSVYVDDDFIFDTKDEKYSDHKIKYEDRMKKFISLLDEKLEEIQQQQEKKKKIEIFQNF